MRGEEEGGMEEGRDTIDIFRGSLSSIPSSLFCLCVGLFYPSTPLPPPLPLRGNEIVPESWPAPFGIIHDAVAISRAGIVYLAGAGEVGKGEEGVSIDRKSIHVGG